MYSIAVPEELETIFTFQVTDGNDVSDSELSVEWFFKFFDSWISFHSFGYLWSHSGIRLQFSCENHRKFLCHFNNYLWIYSSRYKFLELFILRDETFKKQVQKWLVFFFGIVLKLSGDFLVILFRFFSSTSRHKFISPFHSIINIAKVLFNIGLITLEKIYQLLP